MNESYRINLTMFEGPLDLLLCLIKKNDVDICDIPIALITDEYLKYINTLRELNIDFASEFLLTAAELAHIKSKMLLPAEERGGEDEEADPRADLVHRLLEYQRYKEAAATLAGRSMLYRDVFIPQSQERPEAAKDGEVIIEGNVFHLLSAFNKMIEKLPRETVKGVTEDRISVNERIFQLIEMIKFGQTVPLTNILPKEGLTRHIVVITFLAMLEMLRLKIIKIYQAGLFETIYITGAMRETTSLEEIDGEPWHRTVQGERGMGRNGES